MVHLWLPQFNYGSHGFICGKTMVIFIFFPDGLFHIIKTDYIKSHHKWQNDYLELTVVCSVPTVKSLYTVLILLIAEEHRTHFQAFVKYN